MVQVDALMATVSQIFYGNWGERDQSVQIRDSIPLRFLSSMIDGSFSSNSVQPENEGGLRRVVIPN